jgi:cell division cycle protein 20 (cofactor of APC complex)
MMSLLRRSASDLFSKPPRFRPTSVTENLNKQKHCVMMLDGPRISNDAYGSPITWSKGNLIAVACANDVYYQDLHNKAVSHMCQPDVGPSGFLHSIEWAGEGRDTILASGTSTGVVQIWDAGREGGVGKHLRTWREAESTGVGSLDWNGDLLAVGAHDGRISLFDVRSKTDASSVSAHKGRALGLKWSMDGSYLASGDEFGMVCIWDKRAGKDIFDESTHAKKIRHRGPVKVYFFSPS